MIRPATSADIPGVLAVWNPIIRDTFVTFTDRERTRDDLERMLAEKAAAGHAFLVAEEVGDVAGFATFGQFRPGPGYRRAFEHTVLIAPEARGRGLGRSLVGAIEDAARAASGTVIFAGVSAANPDGIAFHAALGYGEVVRLCEVGFKFGRRLDLVLMEKRL